MTLENWLSIGKLKKHTTSKEEMEAIFGLIRRDLKDASLSGLSQDRKFNITYNAAFQTALALLFCYGYVPASESHHYITWQALKEILPKDKSGLVNYFDGCRKKRNISNYDKAGTISEKETKELYEETKNFVIFIKKVIKDSFPEYFSP
ncbi:MAG: hypothetical protein ABIA97_01325 [Candidatus Omnitrophota bacterium]